MANTKIPSELIADSSITAAKLADGTITTADIADSNVTTAKIADSNVTTAKIGDAQITTAKITDANVTTVKIADDAVTTAKMASNSVTSDTIASGITLAGNTTFSGSVITSTLASPDGTGIISLPNTGEASFARGAVFNENSHDSDFRVESNANTHMLFVDAGNNRVGINSSSPSEALQVIGNIGLYGELKLVQAIRHANSGAQVIDNDNDTYFILNDPEGANRIKLGDSGDAANTYRNTTHKFEPASGTEYMRINATGVGIGTSSPAEKLHVAGGHIRINNGYELRSTDTSGNTKTITRVNGSNELEYGWSGAGPVKFMGGGSYSERMRIHTNGNIAINHTSAPHTLTVKGTISRLNSSGIQVTNLQTNNDHGQIAVLNSGGVQKVLIDSNGDSTFNGGNVGIGTASPSSPLHVSAAKNDGWLAQLINTGTGSDANGLDIHAGVDSSDYILRTRHQDGTDAMVVKYGGKVGIGTTGNGARLHIKSAGTGNVLYVESSDGHHLGGFYQESDTRAAFNVRDASGSVKVNLDAGGNSWFTGGNVGIGTTSPTVGKLQVNDGSGAITALTRTSGSTSGDLGTIRFGNTDIDSNLVNIVAFQDGATNSGALKFETQSTGAATAERMRIDSSGNVGIGMNPSGYGKLSVNSTGVILALRASSGAGRLGFYEAGAGRFYLDTLNGSDGLKFVDGDGTSERMRIDSSGRLLIGTTSTTPGFANTNGHAFHTGDASHISRDQGTALIVNRGTNDGNIISLRRAGAEIGTISAAEGPSGSRGLRITSAATLELKTQKQQWYDAVTLGGTAGDTVGLGQFTNNGRGWWVRVTANAHYSNHVSSQVWEFTQSGYVGENHNKWLQVPETVSSSYQHNENAIALDVYRDNVAGSTSTPIQIRFRQKSNGPATGSVYYTVETLNGIGMSLDGKGVSGSVTDTWANTTSANMDGAVGGYYPTRSKYEFPVSDGAFWTDNAVINADGAKGLYISNRGTVGIGFDKHMHTTSNVGMAGNYDHAGTLHLAGDDSIFVQTSTYGSNSEFMHYVYNDYYKIFRNTGGSNQTALHINSSLVVSGDLNDTSDRNLKKNIVDLPDGSLAIVSQLKPVTFDWKNTDKGSNTGFIAQDVKTVLPNDVSGTEYKESNDLHETNDGLSINSTGIVAHLVKAVQELEKRVKELEG